MTLSRIKGETVLQSSENVIVERCDFLVVFLLETNSTECIIKLLLKAMK